MTQEMLVRVGAMLGIMVATKTMSEWSYGFMMKRAKEGYTLDGLGWPKKRQTRFEILAQLAVGSFVMMILFGMLGHKLTALWLSYAFILLTDTFIFAAVAVPGLIGLWKYHHQK